MVLVGVVLLVSAYVEAWLLATCATQRRIFSGSVALQVSPAFYPLRKYCVSGYPGSSALGRLWWMIWMIEGNPHALGDNAPEFVFAPLEPP